MKLPKVYEAQKYENRIYKLWEESGAFQPSKDGEPFSITMPPPNATGRLHVGHAAMLAIEDTLIRYNRMQGKSALWTPGTDHAGIATNAVIEKRLADEGKSKEQVGRKEFLRQLSEFVDESIDTIRSQVRAMGSSTDWTRERYTMEPAMNRIVSEVFINMYKDGLVYRGKRIVNWDHVLQTVVSDDELNYQDEKATLYTFKYGPFEISTARPETKFGDKYVVMHPDDDRYEKFKHGDKFTAEWINGPVHATVIKDVSIDPEFGTGVMTITPWHDVKDFEIAKRHDLDFEQIIDIEGRLLPIADEFSGMHIDAARSKIVDKLAQKGLLVSRDDNYTHRIAVSDRGNAVIEPQVMEQWFIDVNKPAVKWKGKKMTLKEVMQSVVRDGDIEILPSRFEKIYFHWIDNLRDWCISRQIWWGHQIPAWYKKTDDKTEIHVSHVAPDDSWTQDPDTLDTWFSSALWTWSTLIPPEIALNDKYDIKDMIKHAEDFKKYHPTTVMETGYDIIFFWVARMILMTTYNINQIPFKTVYLHGLVRTKDGSKMSKSKPETIIDPLVMIEKYGTDALRLSLLVGQAPGNDMRIYEEKISKFRNFNNKLWNIARFVEDKVSDDVALGEPKPEFDADYWILDRLDKTTKDVARLLDEYQLGKAFDELYHFVWNDYADWYIETSKVQFNESVLVYILEVILKLSHPFIPFVTETIWDTLDWEEGLLIKADWPTTTPIKDEQTNNFIEIINIVSEIRHLRASIDTSENTLYYNKSGFIESNAELITRLAGLNGVKKVESGRGLHLTRSKHDVWIDVQESKAQEYLKELAEKQKELIKVVQKLKERLQNKAYTKSAPKNIVDETKQHLKENEELLAKISDEINTFEYTLGGKT